MNKLNKTAYMLLLWALICLSGCASKGSTKMYLDAKVQTEETHEKKKSENKETAQQTVSDENGGADAAQSGSCFVYVCGAVNRPGVFELKTGSRVYEAIALAGGLRKDAYSKGLNQAAQIKDGDMIEVLTKKEHKEQAEETKAAMESKEELQDGLIDINTASKEELMTLHGIGQAKAADIIAYRESSGGFQTPEEIMNVNGIGEGVYARIQDKIKVIR